jgi:hypothetical protein
LNVVPASPFARAILSEKPDSRRQTGDEKGWRCDLVPGSSHSYTCGAVCSVSFV